MISSNSISQTDTITLIEQLIHKAQQQQVLLVDKAGAAQMLSTSIRAFQGLVTRREGPPHIKLGREFYWSPESIKLWIAQKLAANSNAALMLDEALSLRRTPGPKPKKKAA